MAPEIILQSPSNGSSTTLNVTPNVTPRSALQTGTSKGHGSRTLKLSEDAAEVVFLQASSGTISNGSDLTEDTSNKLVMAAACNSLDCLREEIAQVVRMCEAQLQCRVLACKARITEAESPASQITASDVKRTINMSPLGSRSGRMTRSALGTKSAFSSMSKSLTTKTDGSSLPWHSKPLQPLPAKTFSENVESRTLSPDLEFATGLNFPQRSVIEDEAAGEKGSSKGSMSSWKTVLEKNAFKKFCQRLVLSPFFDGLSALAIFVNSVFLCCVVDLAAGEDPTLNGRPSSALMTISRIFTAWFVIEVIMRIGAEGSRFCCTKDWSWNIFDLVVVGSDMAETVIEIVVGDESEALGGFIALRVLRVLRITRAIRVVRLVRFFRELRMMVYSILRSGTCLVWSLVMLYLIIFIFGIYFTQSVTFYRKEEAQSGYSQDDVMEALLEDLRRMFGGIMPSHYTLFQAICGGVSWGEISDRLIKIHWSNGVIFCFFVFFTVFSVMNIITGIFVDTATHAAHADREEVIQGQLESEDATLWQLRSIFNEADNESSGTITADEFEELLEDQRVKAHMRALGLEIHEARGLFTLLDMDHCGDVFIDEFVTGCMRLKGNAKTLDMQMLMYENKRMFGKLMAFFDYTNVHFSQLKSFEKKVEVCVDRLNSLLFAWPSDGASHTYAGETVESSPRNFKGSSTACSI